MRKLKIYLFVLLLPVLSYGGQLELNSVKEVKLDFYSELNLQNIGLSKEVFDLAIKGLSKLDVNGKLQNATIVTIADYSQSSNKKRLYVIDLKNKKLLFNTYVAHGRNTGEEYAKSFSNVEGSFKSSLGFYVTEKPITGSHTGYSLLLRGVEKGFNDNAQKREIIIHAADYATENFIKKYGRLGRSYGCPALPPELNKAIIEAIKNGTCLFIYNPNNNYLCASALLN
jgi:L,D-transpeptidase catalytic domain